MRGKLPDKGVFSPHCFYKYSVLFDGQPGTKNAPLIGNTAFSKIFNGIYL